MTEALEVETLKRRWQAFLEEISSTFQDTTEEASDPLVGMATEDADGGMVAFAVALQGVKSQLMGLVDKIDTTWESQVYPKLMQADPGGVHWDRLELLGHGRALENRLHAELERWERITNGQAAERIYAAAVKLGSKGFRCSNCSADLKVSENPFLSHYETCPYCSAVSTYEPSTAQREVNWFAVDHLAAYRTTPEWDAMQADHARYSAARFPIPRDILSDLERTFMGYYGAYLDERIRLVPELSKTREADLERYRLEFEVIRGHAG